jgi:hypothetical protein
LKKKTQEQFLEDCKRVHGDKYDYSLAEYKGKDQKITIICPFHGEFIQEANAHVRGHGCKGCANKHSADIKSKTKEAFIQQSIERFADRFGYDSVDYINGNTPVKLLCKEHNFVFEVAPSNHLRVNGKGGCRLCRKDNSANSLLKGRQYYIDKIEAALKDNIIVKEYPSEIKNHDSITATCLLHGDFRIRVGNIVRGKSCPSCANYGFKNNKPATFYILKITENVIKFGITSDINRRLYQIRRKSCFDIKILHEFIFTEGKIAKQIESSIKTDSSIVKSVVNRCDMGCGFNETTYIYNLPKIIEIVNSFTNNTS